MRRKRNKVILLLLYALVLVSASFIYSRTVPPKGDEVHYLITATSIIEDKDIWLENNYPPDLDQHVVKGYGGHHYLYHGLGLFPFLISPGLAILGRFGAILTISLISLALLVHIYKFILEICESEKISLIITAIAAINLPLANYFFLLFPEVVGALLIIIPIRYYFKSKYNDTFIFLAIGLLPWIHIRFLPVGIILLLLWMTKTKSYQAIISVLLYIGYFIFLYIIYGSFDPTWPYQLLNIETGSGNLLTNIISVFIDREYGLLAHSPVYIFIFPGFLIWYRKNKSQLLTILALILIYSIAVFRYYDWHGGYSPPARYLTSIIPLFLPMIALFIRHRKSLLLKLTVTVFSVWGVMAYVANLQTPPNHGFVYKDGTSSYLIKLNTITNINIHDLFPSYYPDEKLSFLHAIWIAAIISFLVIFKKLNQKKA